MVFRYIRQLVSKKRKRFVCDGFDLDLSYITDRIIAMSYPADQQFEAIYRNPMKEVQELLNRRHRGHYKVYNLCSECQYSPSYFDGRVEVLPFDDHHVPPLSLIKVFCTSVHSWLHEDPQNTVVVHCRAGKGRTGLMLCCYLVFTGRSPQEALQLYSQMRTTDMLGVTIASQRRYVHYWGSIVTPGLESPHAIGLPPPVSRALRRVRLYDMVGDRVDFTVEVLEEKSGELYAPPQERARGQCTVSQSISKIPSLRRYWLTRAPVEREADTSQLALYHGSPKWEGTPKWVVQMDTERSFDPQKTTLDHSFENPVLLCGNVYITFYDKGGSRLFFVCFNTSFITNGLLALKQDELDRVPSRLLKKLGPDFSLELLFGMVQPTSGSFCTGAQQMSGPLSHSGTSDADLSGP